MSWVDDVDRAMKAVEQEIERLKAQTGEDTPCGVMRCPICNAGELIWIIMPNGHLHMDCTDATCVHMAQ